MLLICLCGKKIRGTDSIDNGFSFSQIFQFPGPSACSLMQYCFHSFKYGIVL